MEYRRTITRCGRTVTLLVSPIRDGRWQLRVQGRCRQYFTDWILPFETPASAFRAALHAIRREGIEPFHEAPPGD